MTEKKHYIFLNWFKGYRCFELHGPVDHHCDYLEGGEKGSVDYKIFAFTCFYLRVELFFAYNHIGKRWI